MEFIMRQSAAKLGFNDSLDDLDSFTAECFAIISSEISKLTEESMEKARRKGGKGRG